MAFVVCGLYIHKDNIDNNDMTFFYVLTIKLV